MTAADLARVARPAPGGSLALTRRLAAAGAMRTVRHAGVVYFEPAPPSSKRY